MHQRHLTLIKGWVTRLLIWVFRFFPLRRGISNLYDFCSSYFDAIFWTTSTRFTLYVVIYKYMYKESDKWFPYRWNSFQFFHPMYFYGEFHNKQLQHTNINYSFSVPTNDLVWTISFKNLSHRLYIIYLNLKNKDIRKCLVLPILK